MALKQIQFSSKEINNLLIPCWIAGERKLSTTNLVKLFDQHEIKAVDVVDCCKRIREIIDGNQAQREQICNSVNDRSNRFVAFKDIARLTFGVSYIHRQQVSTLLDETKRLLQQMKGTNFGINIVPILNCSNRKRKRVIVNRTTTTVCVSKRPRIMSPQLLDEDHVDYYRNMLTESQLWSKDSEVLNIKESQTICTLDHFINITQEVTFTEMEQNLLWNDGFGECTPMDQTALDDFLPFRNSLKRKSPYPNVANGLCYKTSKLSKNELNIPSNAIELQCNINPQEHNLVQGDESSAVQPVPCSPPATAVQPKKLKGRNQHKCKLKIDKCIKCSREMLDKDRKLYYKGLVSIQNVKPQIIKQSDAWLNCFNQCHLFPGRLKSCAQVSREQMEMDCEYTIRAIFGVDYTDGLASSILGNNEATPQQINSLEEFAEPAVPAANSPEHQLLHALELQPSNNNKNNNEIEHIQSHFYKNIDSLSIMMNLLGIWHKDPYRKSIDANQFVKSFPDRFSAAMAFTHLLALSRDGFILLSTKLKSREIDAITLGPESIKLITNISEFKQFN